MLKLHKNIKRLLNLPEILILHAKHSRFSEFKTLRWLLDFLIWPSDLIKVFNSYKYKFGFYPNILKPSRFNEFLQQAKLYKRKSIYTQFADKLKVREFVGEAIGQKYLSDILWHGEDLREAKKLKIEAPFIIKANQGSGTNIIVRDADSFDWDKVWELTQDWLKHDHSTHFAEWQYRWIKPKILIERLLTTEGKVPIDYKFFCFHGRAVFVQVDLDRFENHTRSFYDRNFDVLPFGLEYKKYTSRLLKPSCFDEMINLAEILAGEETFIRVDFYDVSGPVFGELTLHPEAGLGKFDPDKMDYWVGMLTKKCFLDELTDTKKSIIDFLKN
jgi:hypothetical protein